MHINEVAYDLMEVPGFPQLRCIAPTITELAEVNEKLGGFNPATDRESSAEAVLWLFQSFVRDPDGQPIEGIETVEQAATEPRFPLIIAVIDTVTGLIALGKRPLPKDDDGPLPDPVS